MKTYVKKPLEIEAVQFTGGVNNATPIVIWVVENGGMAAWHEAKEEWVSEDGVQGYPAEDEYMGIHTLEGLFRAPVGWWIIRGVVGEFYACDPEVFEKTYDPVDV